MFGHLWDGAEVSMQRSAARLPRLAGAARRRISLRWAVAAVVVVGLVLTAVLAVVTFRGHQRAESRLLGLQTRLIAAAGQAAFIVGQLADTWGITPSPAGPGKTVWFQTALRTGVAAAGRAAAPVLAGGDPGWQQGQLGRAEAGADRAHDGEDREAMREMLAQARSARQAARLDRYAADQDRVAADRDRGSAQADRRAAGDDRQVARADRDQAMIESEEEDSPLMD